MPSSNILPHHYKINELDIVLDLYTVGDCLGVAGTELGTVGLAICADDLGSSMAVGHVLARMGAQLLLSGERSSSACPSPSTWAGTPILTAVKIARVAPSGEPVG